PRPLKRSRHDVAAAVGTPAPRRPLEQHESTSCQLGLDVVELVQIRGKISDLLVVLQSRVDHLRAGDLPARVADVLSENLVVPSDAGLLVCVRVSIAWHRACFAPEQPVEHRAYGVSRLLAHLMAAAALVEDLLALLSITGRPGRQRGGA